jgi:poly(A) polymerase
MLRAVRLAVELDFEIDPSTVASVRLRSATIHEAAPERQRDELARCFATDHAARAIRLMDELTLLQELLPEVTAGRGVPQPEEYHYYDVFDHCVEAVAALDFMLAAHPVNNPHEARLQQTLWDTLAVWDNSAAHALRDHLQERVSEGRTRSALLKLAGLLHDVAKPETRAPDASGRIRFFGHAERGAETARRVLRRLRFSRREVELASIMVDEHLRPTQLGQPGELPTRRALFRFFRDTGDAAESVLLLSLADALAARGPGMTVDAWQGYVSYIGYVLARRHGDSTITRPVRLLTGGEIMSELGAPPGPEIGRLLASLEEAQAGGDVMDRAQAIALVRRLHDRPFRPRALAGAGRP